MAKQILLNAFNMNCVAHQPRPVDPSADTSTQYKTLDYWTELARLLERGLFDGLFIADIVGTYDVYGKSLDVTLKESIQLPVNDPLLLVSAMAAVTRHLGFGLTANLTYEAPYLFARRMSTLDHLSNGRVGWNIVTGYLDSAARAMGLSSNRARPPLRPGRRIPAGAVQTAGRQLGRRRRGRRPRAARLCAPGQGAQGQHHHGEFYQVEGYHLCEPSPQRTPVLFQAGSSARGLAFRRQPCRVRVHQRPDKAATRAQVDKVRAAAQPPVATRRQSRCSWASRDRRRHRERPGQARRVPALRQRRGRRGALRRVHRHRFAPTRWTSRSASTKGNAIQSATRQLQDNAWTRRRLLEQHALGGRYVTLVGARTGGRATDRWIDETGLDGFNLTRTVTPESFEDFIDLVVPNCSAWPLQDRLRRRHPARKAVPATTRTCPPTTLARLTATPTPAPTGALHHA
jgi:alkanesulfonate monooxygenase SsuD/methylene tetrahydromethanopterin reductase-like flavin-dependent oxidoreductase (luciferase family)